MRCGSLVVVILLGAVAGGCLAPWISPSGLPDRNWLVRDQLIIHSDFPVAAHHRLWEELTALRVTLSQQLSLPVSDEPIHVYLFETAARFEGFMRARHPNSASRRAFFVETDTRLAVYAVWGDRVADDLRHEVTHGYLHAVVPHLPLWLDEGLAEYFEVPRGNHGLNSDHLAQIARRLDDGTFRPNMERLEALDPSLDMSAEDYAESWAWVHFLLEGDLARRDLLGEYLHQLRQPGTAEPLSCAVRRLVADPDRQLVDHLRRLTGKSTPPDGPKRF